MASVQQVASVAEVVANVRAIAPQLAALAVEAERRQDPAPEAIDLLRDAGVYRTTLAKSLGGFEASLDERFDVLLEIGRADPALSWTTAIHMDGIRTIAKLNPEFQQEVLASRSPQTAGVFAPTAKGVHAPGGLRVSGRWDFNTGGRSAAWLFMNIMVEGKDGGPPEPWNVGIPRADAKSLDNWDVMGMAGTGSHSTVAEDVFVPYHRARAAGARMSRPKDNDENLAYHDTQYVLAAVTGALVGAARGAMDRFLERLPGRRITFTDYADQSQAAVTHLAVAAAELDIDAAEMFARKNNLRVDAARGAPMTLRERAKTRAYTGRVAALCRSGVEKLFDASGASSIYRDVPIQRYYRDLLAVSIHAFVLPSSAEELYGRTLLGLEPNSTLL